MEHVAGLPVWAFINLIVIDIWIVLGFVGVRPR